jgi:hypothetical protein
MCYALRIPKTINKVFYTLCSPVGGIDKNRLFMTVLMQYGNVCLASGLAGSNLKGTEKKAGEIGG